MSLKSKIKVLIADDQLLIRTVLKDLIQSDSRFEVVDAVSNGQLAVERARILKPDVITMDVEMPVMDGIAAVKQIMQENPCPIVMISSITYEGGFKTLEALEAGAFDFIQKPKAQAASSLKTVGEAILKKLFEAHSHRRKSFTATKTAKAPIPIEVGKPLASETESKKLLKLKHMDPIVFAIGISTGGPPCIAKIFEALPAHAPAVLVVQHMPPQFTKAMADRINTKSAMTVKEADDGDVIRKGYGYIAPGHAHITIKRFGTEFRIVLSEKGKVSGHQPSADVLFESVAQNYGPQCCAAIMTGMGRDGADQLKVLRDKGAYTLAQNQESCVVYSMPKAAVDLGAADEILNLDQIIQRFRSLCG